MGIILFRILLVYLVYLGIKSLLNKFLGPVENDSPDINTRSRPNNKNKSKDAPIEADYRVIK